MKWRTGGARDGAWDGTTFDAHTDAKQFKALVEVHGRRWPPAELLIAKGFAYLVPGAVITPAAPVVEEPLRLFHTAPLSALDWAILAGFGVLLLAADEIRKVVVRARGLDTGESRFGRAVRH